MKVAIISHINQHSPFGKVTEQFVAALQGQGHEFKVIAFPPTSEFPLVEAQMDGPNVWRVNTESSNYEIDIAEVLKDQGFNALVVNKECFPDQRKLETLVKAFTSPTNRSFLIVHSDDYDSKFQYHLFTALLLPDSKFRRPPASSVRFLQQGIPEFAPLKDKVNWRRENGFLPPMERNADDGDLIQEGFVLATFAGKTDIEKILSVIQYVNQYQLTKKPVYLLVQDGRGTIEQYQALTAKYQWLLPSVGYLPDDQLAEMFQASDGFICLYPETKSLYTSSALRFAMGCGLPTITNTGGHCKDIVATILADSLNPESIKHAIVSLFANFGRYSITARRSLEVAMKTMGWANIAKEFAALVPVNSTKPTPINPGQKKD